MIDTYLLKPFEIGYVHIAYYSIGELMKMFHRHYQPHSEYIEIDYFLSKEIHSNEEEQWRL